MEGKFGAAALGIFGGEFFQRRACEIAGEVLLEGLALLAFVGGAEEVPPGFHGGAGGDGGEGAGEGAVVVEFKLAAEFFDVDFGRKNRNGEDLTLLAVNEQSIAALEVRGNLSGGKIGIGRVKNHDTVVTGAGSQF